MQADRQTDGSGKPIFFTICEMSTKYGIWKHWNVKNIGGNFQSILFAVSLKLRVRNFSVLVYVRRILRWFSTNFL